MPLKDEPPGSVGVQGVVEFHRLALAGRTSTAPVVELRRNRRFGTPDSSTALTTLVVSSPSASFGPTTRTRVPAVTYRPASTTESSPMLIPTPELAPSRTRSPMAIFSLPPPDRVPMMDAPPPTSLPSPATTPAEMRPSTMDVPRVPALKFTKPSCITVVPSARWAPRRTRSASAILTPAGTT